MTYSVCARHIDRRLKKILYTMRCVGRPGRAEDETTALEQKIFTRGGFKFAPNFVRATHQRHVVTTFAEGYPRYSAFTVRRAIFMWGMKHVDAKHFRPAASQLIKRC